jgi:hypothetical protein
VGVARERERKVPAGKVHSRSTTKSADLISVKPAPGDVTELPRPGQCSRNHEKCLRRQIPYYGPLIIERLKPGESSRAAESGAFKSNRNESIGLADLNGDDQRKCNRGRRSHLSSTNWMWQGLFIEGTSLAHLILC